MAVLLSRFAGTHYLTNVEVFFSPALPDMKKSIPLFEDFQVSPNFLSDTISPQVTMRVWNIGGTKMT
jgi:hypothetical protein